jgi:hypothetical protein
LALTPQVSIALKHANGLPAGVFKVQPLIHNAALSFRSVRLPLPLPPPLPLPRPRPRPLHLPLHLPLTLALTQMHHLFNMTAPLLQQSINDLANLHISDVPPPSRLGVCRSVEARMMLIYP